MTLKEIEELAGHRQVPAWVVKLVSDAVAIEREACAALCFQMWDKWLDKDARDEFVRPDAEDCAAAIRARGQG
jgi:hypothetical protein